MTRGRLGSPLSGFGSSDSEDVAEQQLHLQDRHSVNGYQESETKESTDLEQLFKSFAGNRAVAEMAFKAIVHLKIYILSSFTDPHAIPPPATVLLPTFFKISSFVFISRKKIIQVWNMEFDDNFHFWVNCLFMIFHLVFYLSSIQYSIPFFIYKNVFKCYLMPGIQSDSEESTNYHTINQTFDVTNGVLDATSQTEVIQFSFVPFH